MKYNATEIHEILCIVSQQKRDVNSIKVHLFIYFIIY